MQICPRCLQKRPDEEDRCRVDGERLLPFAAEDRFCGTLVANGRFLVLEPMGAGAMSAVYRAWQLSTGRTVALKVLPADVAGRRDRVQRFEREARVTASLRSPYTVRVHDFGELPDGRLFIAMEDLEGHSLARLLEIEGCLAPERACALLGQICESLAEAHEKHLVHRDLKPANVMVRRTPSGAEFATVLDFGIVKVAGATSSLATHDGAVLGTPMYISPEQIRSDPRIGPAADIYAAGAMLFHLVTGSPPFPAGSVAEVFARHLSDAPPPLPERVGAPALVAGLDAIVRRCLAKEAAARFASAGDLGRELRRLLPAPAAATPQGPPGAAARAPSGPRPAAPSITGETETGTGDPAAAAAAGTGDPAAAAPAGTGDPAAAAGTGGQTRWRRRDTRIALALTGTAVLAAAVAVLWWWPGARPLPGLPPAPRVAVLPFEGAAERTVDRRLWPLVDRMVVNALQEAAADGPPLQLVDPLRVEAELRRRELAPPFAPGAVQELGAALPADLGLAGQVAREEGAVVLRARLQRVGVDDDALELSGRGSDVLAAAADLAAAVRTALPQSLGPAAQPPTGGGLPPTLRAAWRALLRDPWSGERYDALKAAAAGAGAGPGAGEDAAFAAFADSVAGAPGPERPCAAPAAALAAAHPGEVGTLATAVCRFRQYRWEEALAAAEAAFDDLGLRPEAAAFASKVDVQVRTVEARIRALQRRASLFPHEVEVWWLLAVLSSSDEAETAAAEVEDVARVAEFLSAGRDVSFGVALNAVRTAMQMGDLARAETWLQRLDRAAPQSDWDVLWRAGRKSALLQLRGRFREGQAVLEEARRSLAPRAADPYTIAATALFYSCLHFGQLHEAEGVAAEYLSFFGDTARADHWAARLLDVSLRAARGTLAPEQAVTEAEGLAESLLRAIGPDGRRERDAFLCLVLSHLPRPAESHELLRAADPGNTMVAGCRYHAARALLAEGRDAEAREQFARARREILFRSDWYLELYLPALLGEAEAAEGAGDVQGARALYEAVARQYRDADRDLPERRAAQGALARLGR
jgi:serine/threonine-protein kinase